MTSIVLASTLHNNKEIHNERFQAQGAFRICLPGFDHDSCGMPQKSRSSTATGSASSSPGSSDRPHQRLPCGNRTGPIGYPFMDHNERHIGVH
jgi:hypothetical protein